MSDAGASRFGKLIRLAVVAAALGAAPMLNPAQAQVYLGWDFGHGIGIGIGTPPSAYTPCPDYGWGPFYPFRCHYYGYRRWHRRVVAHHPHVRRSAPRTAWVSPE